MSKIPKINARWKTIAFLSVITSFPIVFLCLLFSEYKLIWLYLYSAVSNSPLNWIVPVTPQEPIVLLYGQIYEPLLVAFIAGVSSFLLEIYNYQILVPTCNISQLEKFKRNRFYRIFERNFSKIPFIMVTIVGFTPLPHLPIRILSVTSGYSIYKYAFASFAGRFPFYYILAETGSVFDISYWVYILLFLIMIFLTVIGKIIMIFKKRFYLKKASISSNCIKP